MVLDQWAQKWGIPSIAMDDLKQKLGVDTNSINFSENKSEAALQNIIRLEASQKGARLWRNNVGALYTQRGDFLRYGLANESPAVNRLIKSADLIGLRPVLITRAMVGMTIGQFMSREVKASDWKYTGNERELAQLRWSQLIVSLGGDACFANHEGTIHATY